MNAKLAILCPGQGGQHAGMFDLALADVRAAEFVRRSLAMLDASPSLEAIQRGEADLFANRLAQPLVVAASLAAWMALGDGLPSPALVAGYSIGEISAHAVAGTFDARQAVSVAVRRAALMEACREADGPQGLLAVSGMLVAQQRALAREAGVDVAIETGEDSAILGGHLPALEALRLRAEGLGGRCHLLPVEVASHTPLMQAAASAFAAMLEQEPMRPCAVPVLSGIGAERVSSVPLARLTLARQVAETVRWKDCMDALAESGVTVALELGPGNALARMVAARNPQIACRSVSDFKSLQGAKRWLERAIED
ncbi:[acyl-carrier-protein] S-malonyltransferase [Noviherbaspirillum humi]|uniref:[acyl-carrier-protein] S-malonyltransferase n=1 Tax=Noviherbaspirillum humi TaxID=1688639 RepID=A0A239L1F7_9BURK|nr:acyltransferase domain-containing protein [Noviherbaspirillum humi]SNT23748.1 [acyl-carrier-protein] S-malonyltransferase [Noviherbaspirillum humi]